MTDNLAGDKATLSNILIELGARLDTWDNKIPPSCAQKSQ